MKILKMILIIGLVVLATTIGASEYKVQVSTDGGSTWGTEVDPANVLFRGVEPPIVDPPPDDPPPPEDPPPVSELEDTAIIFSNGLFGSSSNANNLFKYLEGKGYPRARMNTLSVPDNSKMCSTKQLDAIQSAVTKAVADGAQRVVLIGHSRGGTMSYNFMFFRPGAESVNDVITLAGANNFNCNSAYGQKGSDKTPGTALYTSLSSPADKLVAQWVDIEGAKNISIDGVAHTAFIRDQQVFALVLQALQGGGSNN